MRPTVRSPGGRPRPDRAAAPRARGAGGRLRGRGGGRRRDWCCCRRCCSGCPGPRPVQILATNKLAAICGTTVSSATYYRRVRPDPRTFLPLMAFSFVGAVLGALVATLIPAEAFDPIVLVALVVVGAYVLLKPDLGDATALRFSGHRHLGLAMLDRAGDRLLRRRARPRHRLVLRLHARRAARLLLPRGERQGPAGQLDHQPRRARRLRARWARCSGRSGWSWARATCSAATSAPGSRSRGAAASCGSSSSLVVSAFVVRIGGDVLGVW